MRHICGIDWLAVGRRIRHLRHPRKIRQYVKELGYCRDTGYISLIENGKCKPSLGILLKIADEGEVDIHWLIYGKEPYEAPAIVRERAITWAA